MINKLNDEINIIIYEILVWELNIWVIDVMDKMVSYNVFYRVKVYEVRECVVVEWELKEFGGY